MIFFLIPVKDSKHTFLELHQKGLFHFISNLIKESSHVLMLIIVVQKPP